MSDETNEVNKASSSSIDNELLKSEALNSEGDMKLTINIPYYEASDCVTESSPASPLISNVEVVKEVDQVEPLKVTILVNSPADSTSTPPPAPPPPPAFFKNIIQVTKDDSSSFVSSSNQVVLCVQSSLESLPDSEQAPPTAPPIPPFFNAPSSPLITPPPPPPLMSNLSTIPPAPPPPPPPFTIPSTAVDINNIPPPPPPPAGLFNSISSNVPPPPPPPPGNETIPPPPPAPPFNGFPPPPPPPPGHLNANLRFPAPPPPLFPMTSTSNRPTRLITRRNFKPKEEMKTLYWNRIQIFKKNDSIWFDVEEPELNDDFVSLFAKVTLTRSMSIRQSRMQSMSSLAKPESVKLLESKRSQALGILITSQRLDSQVIRDVLIGFNADLLSYETLSSIYALRPQEDELRMINDYLKANNMEGEDQLDKPEQFLLELSKIPAFEERIYCLVYQNKFKESISSIEFRLNNMNTICDELFSSEKIKKILGIVLACGNCMNSSNASRGDADGYDLAILTNLKDVKSKDNSTNLLQYVAYYYVNHIDDDLKKLPVPDPSDFNYVSQVSFDELEKELRRVRNELKDIEQRLASVVVQTESDASKSSLLEPFQSKMNMFLNEANEECDEQEDSLIKCRDRFRKLVDLYSIKPKASDTEVTPEYFFSIWSTFCLDFKDAWKRESQKLNKQRMKHLNEKRKQLRTKNTEVKPIEKKSIKAFFKQKRTEEMIHRVIKQTH